MSNTFKGTPGPWKVDKKLIFSDDFFQTHIAKITPTSFNAEIRKANAQLISCAPDMLEALINIYESQDAECHLDSSINQMIQSLITRATTI